MKIDSQNEPMLEQGDTPAMGLHTIAPDQPTRAFQVLLPDGSMLTFEGHGASTENGSLHIVRARAAATWIVAIFAPGMWLTVKSSLPSAADIESYIERSLKFHEEQEALRQRVAQAEQAGQRADHAFSNAKGGVASGRDRMTH